MLLKGTKMTEDKKDLAIIEADKKGVLTPKNLESQWRIAKYYSSSGMLPKQFNTPEKVLVAMQYCYELNIKPLTGMRQIAIIQGIPCAYGDLPLGIARSSGNLEYIKEQIIDKNTNEICADNKNLTAEPFAAVCKIKRKNEPEIVAAYSIEDAKNAGLLSRSDCWRKYPKDMLKYRARSRALKDAFADLLNGVAIAEYDYAEMPDKKKLKEDPVISPKQHFMNVASTLTSSDVNKTINDVDNTTTSQEFDFIKEGTLEEDIS